MAMSKEIKREQTKREETRREEVDKLLPFYVTGRLDQADAEEIDDYLKHHPDVARGLDLGADAYLTKQKFDQRQLLDTIGQLL